MSNWQYCTLEWLWDVGSLRLNLPDGSESRSDGKYTEVVALLNSLGGQGWEVASCVASSNWLFWTLKRSLSSGPSLN